MRHGLSQGCSCLVRALGLLHPLPCSPRRGLPSLRLLSVSTLVPWRRLARSLRLRSARLPPRRWALGLRQLEESNQQRHGRWPPGPLPPVQPLQGCSGSLAAGLGSHTSGTELLTLLIRLSAGDANQLRQTWALPACLVCWAALPATAWQPERPPVTRACEQIAPIRWAAGNRTFSSWAVAKAQER